MTPNHQEQTAEDILNNPKLRADFLRLVRRYYPSSIAAVFLTLVVSTIVLMFLVPIQADSPLADMKDVLTHVTSPLAVAFIMPAVLLAWCVIDIVRMYRAIGWRRAGGSVLRHAVEMWAAACAFRFAGNMPFIVKFMLIAVSMSITAAAAISHLAMTTRARLASEARRRAALSGRTEIDELPAVFKEFEDTAMGSAA